MTRSYIRVPEVPPLGWPGKLSLAVAGALLGPPAGVLARWRGVPGLAWHLRAYRLALRVTARDPGALARPLLQRLVLFPMDSTRYFEFDRLWRWLAPTRFERYLDVSSPRLFPLGLLLARPGVQADLVNPSPVDLADTGYLLERAGLGGRGRLHASTIGDARLSAESYDVVTSISVVEHIPDDAGALRAMWRLLRPGGRLLLTVPCARVSSEQYIDRNYYGVLAPDDDGFSFWQRFYDEGLLRERLFAVAGAPSRTAVYGEKMAGSLQRNLERKRTDPGYPLWREPLMMARGYASYPDIADLPGEGVIALEFVKPAAA